MRIKIIGTIADVLHKSERNMPISKQNISTRGFYPYEDCDGRFAFIAGYTDGGAPYGVMWEEVGIDPGLPFEEKVKLYHMQMLG